MGYCKEYKKCVELKDLTPQIIREWQRKNTPDEIILVKRQIFFCCPLTDSLVSEAECHNCAHNYGNASSREIYCVPKGDKVRSTRVQRRSK